MTHRRPPCRDGCCEQHRSTQARPFCLCHLQPRASERNTCHSSDRPESLNYVGRADRRVQSDYPPFRSSVFFVPLGFIVTLALSIAAMVPSNKREDPATSA